VCAEKAHFVSFFSSVDNFHSFSSGAEAVPTIARASDQGLFLALFLGLQWRSGTDRKAIFYLAPGLQLFFGILGCFWFECVIIFTAEVGTKSDKKVLFSELIRLTG
jgi:hypothetical protein